MMNDLLAQGEIVLKAMATDSGHVLEPFAVHGYLWRRSVCVNCGMLWDLRITPEIKTESRKVWGVAKLEQPNRRPSRNEKGEKLEPTSMQFGYLPPRCEDVYYSGFGVWSFGLDVAA